MPVPLSAALAQLLSDTQRLLAEVEPNLADWQDYGRRRNELFQRLQNTSGATTKNEREEEVRAQLYAQVLEHDRLLIAKIAQHLSAISRELKNLTGERRLARAYASVNCCQIFHRFTA